MTVIYFKTSHVIVYLQRIRTRHSYPLISKHLMLLFILKDERDELKYMHLMLLFISKGSWVFKNSFWISKHLMLLFIASANAWVLPNKTISKHLMLLFI